MAYDRAVEYWAIQPSLLTDESTAVPHIIHLKPVFSDGVLVSDALSKKAAWW
jgi:hypothetical protein